MLPEQIGYLTIVISLIGVTFYVKDMIKGSTRPNRVTWFIWSLAPMIGAFLQFKSGGGLSAIPVFMAGFASFLVFLFSFFYKNSYWKIHTLDIICGVLSLTALVFWIITRNFAISILFAILGDALAYIPTLIKSWKFPETETGTIYFLGIINYILGLLIIKDWHFSIYIFSVYLIIMNSITLFCIYRKKIFSEKIIV
jgi:hypothetical protein